MREDTTARRGPRIGTSETNRGRRRRTMSVDANGRTHRPKGMPKGVAGTFGASAAARGDADLDESPLPARRERIPRGGHATGRRMVRRRPGPAADRRQPRPYGRQPEHRRAASRLRQGARRRRAPARRGRRRRPYPFPRLRARQPRPIVGRAARHVRRDVGGPAPIQTARRRPDSTC